MGGVRGRTCRDPCVIGAHLRRSPCTPREPAPLHRDLTAAVLGSGTPPREPALDAFAQRGACFGRWSPSRPGSGRRTTNATGRSEEHTAELPSLMRIQYADF